MTKINLFKYSNKWTSNYAKTWKWSTTLREQHSELDFSFVDGLDDLLGVLLVDSDTNRLSSSEDALDGTSEGLRERFVVSLHDLSDFLDLLKRKITSVLD